MVRPPKIASFPKSISTEDNRQGKPVRRPEPEVGILLSQLGNTVHGQARLSLCFTPADSGMCHVPLISARFTSRPFPNGSCISLSGSLLTSVKGSVRDPLFSQTVNFKQKPTGYDFTKVCEPGSRAERQRE